MSDAKFLADEMLGRLARWLRLLGYDTLYLSPADDQQLVRRARADGRILLTRDASLAQRRNLDALLIVSDRVQEQLAQVYRQLHLSTDNRFARCALCNVVLDHLDKEAARAQVPPYVFQTQSAFRRCPACQRIYWRGTHWQRMQKLLETLDKSNNL